jgi:hypothetical protein
MTSPFTRTCITGPTPPAIVPLARTVNCGAAVARARRRSVPPGTRPSSPAAAAASMAASVAAASALSASDSALPSGLCGPLARLDGALVEGGALSSPEPPQAASHNVLARVISRTR